MKIIVKKSNVIISAVLFAILNVFVIANIRKFTDENVTYGILLFIIAELIVVLTSFIQLIKIDFEKEKVKSIVDTVLIFLIPVASMTMVEVLNTVFIYDFYYGDFFVSIILYMLFYGIIYAVCGSFRWTSAVINTVFFAFGLTNYYVNAFTGSPFQPLDFLSVSTATKVAGTYDFSPTHLIVLGTVLYIGIMVISFKVDTPPMPFRTKLISRITPVVAMLAVCFVFFFTDVFASCGLKPDFWNQARAYHESGFLLNFCLNTKYTYYSAPHGYDKDKVEDIMDEVIENSGITEGKADNTGKVNVICIMNEAFSDLSVCGELKTNVDPLKNFNALKKNEKNCYYGNLAVPVHGNGTSNTEYEFLTGNSISFFPAGSNAYMLYVRKPINSMVSLFKNNGYYCRAFHPYYATGWNRNKVYDYLGFDIFNSLNSVIRPSIISDFVTNGLNYNKYMEDVEKEYPGENILSRIYVNDSYNYKCVEKYMDESTGPQFIFNVTMQNHGAYSYDTDNFDVDVTIDTKCDNANPNRYLSMLKLSDKAIKELIDHYSKSDERTAICIFGDHQPGLGNDFYAELLGKKIENLSTKERMRGYITPFFIWANYDINDGADKDLGTISANYLQSYFLRLAGIKGNKHNDYLYALSKELPVITTIGYQDSDGKTYDNGEKSEYSELLKDYEKVCYYYAFDAKVEK